MPGFSEDFNTNPTARGWHHEGSASPAYLNWSAIELAIGGRFDRELNLSDRYVKAVSGLTQNDTFEWKGDIEVQVVNAGADYGRQQFGLANSSFLDSNGLKNKVVLQLYRKGLHQLSWYAQVMDKDGNTYTSATSTVFIFDTPINTTNWYFEYKYDGTTKTLTIDIFDGGHVYIETVSVTIPGGAEFAVNEIGVFNAEVAGTHWQKAWLDNLTWIPPPPIGRPFFQGRP